MEHISEDNSLYKAFLEVLPNGIKITDEQKKNIFDLFVNIAYLYFMEQT